jgi:hypothetical protein
MSGPGRPTLYKPEYASRAGELCARGAANPDLAGCFGVARGAIGQWIATHPEFAEAVQQGRDVADAIQAEPALWVRRENDRRKGRKGRKLPVTIRRVGFVNDINHLDVRCGGRFAPLGVAETGGNRRNPCKNFARETARSVAVSPKGRTPKP